MRKTESSAAKPLRVPRMRFTLRSMMVGVAVLAWLTFCAQTIARWQLFRKLAQSHAAHEVRLRAEVAPVLEFVRETGYWGCGVLQSAVEAECERAEWHCQLKLKYQRAALHPWLPLEPDAPEPQ
jgi:hypothetical protein